MMNLFKPFPLALLTLGISLNSISVFQAQEPQKWKSFGQTFSIPNQPQSTLKYAHQVTLDKGKFITKFSREFNANMVFTGTVTTNLAEIDTRGMKVVKGKEGYSPSYWYLYVPVKNPSNAPERKRATPQTDRNRLIIKDQVSNINGRKTEEVWVLTKMYLNFDNEAAARQAVVDITAACQ